jgi:quercetin dioxygenase-like cupin family protein
MIQSDIAAFKVRLQKKYYQLATKTMEPSLVLADHTHDADIPGLVTAGEIAITIDGETRHGLAVPCRR